jgi:hypothetical protein
MSKEMKLSKQAIGSIMMALQKSLMEQTDIVPVFESFKVKLSEEGLVVLNPPLVKFNEEATEQFSEDTEEVEQNEASESA